MRAVALAAMLAFAGVSWPYVENCTCDPAKPETLELRECSLCKEVEKLPPSQTVVLVRDNSPRKPNRWLALPRIHGAHGDPIAKLAPAIRTKVWEAAIAKGREMWGDQWGIAYNAGKVRTQCHLHLHIGKLLQGLAPGRYVDVDRPDQIPVDAVNDMGMWVHQQGKKLRVHFGETATETVLLR